MGKHFIDGKPTKEYFYTEMTAFRKIMCSTKYTQEEKDKAFGALSYVYFIVGDEDDDDMIFAWTALAEEFASRTTMTLFG